MSSSARVSARLAVEEPERTFWIPEKKGRSREGGTEDWKRSWVSVTGVYNWLDCRVLIWFCSCPLSWWNVSSLPLVASRRVREIRAMWPAFLVRFLICNTSSPSVTPA
jgi:hypothetical protein